MFSLHSQKQQKIDHKKSVLLVGYEDEENLGLRSIAAFLKSKHIRTGILPWNGNSSKSVLTTIQRHQPLIIGFSIIFQRMTTEFASLIEFLRSNGIKAHFTAGGHFPTLNPNATFDEIPGLDSVIRHEGELTLLNLYESLSKNKPWRSILGVVYRNKKGTTFINNPRPLVSDLDSLPFPIRSRSLPTICGISIATLIASRGCFYSCSFCSIHAFYSGAPGRLRRTRSAQNVIREMEHLYTTKNAHVFIFKDDDLSCKGAKQIEWIHEFASSLRKSILYKNIAWRISCRVDELDTNILRELKNIGLTWLYLGIESGNNQGLRTCMKKFSPKDIKKGLEIIEGCNLKFEYGFMLFDPSSSFESINENLTMLELIGNNGRAPIHFTKMLPYAGTPIEKQLKIENRLSGSVSHPDYDYKDSRVGLFQYFVMNALGYRIFNINGSVNRLQAALFKSEIMKRFMPHSKKRDKYISDIKSITIKTNNSTLNILRTGLSLMQKHSSDDIKANWLVFEQLITIAQSEESRIKKEIFLLEEQTL